MEELLFRRGYVYFLKFIRKVCASLADLEWYSKGGVIQPTLVALLWHLLKSAMENTADAIFDSRTKELGFGSLGDLDHYLAQNIEEVFCIEMYTKTYARARVASDLGLLTSFYIVFDEVGKTIADIGIKCSNVDESNLSRIQWDMIFYAPEYYLPSGESGKIDILGRFSWRRLVAACNYYYRSGRVSESLYNSCVNVESLLLHEKCHLAILKKLQIPVHIVIEIESEGVFALKFIWSHDKDEDSDLVLLAPLLLYPVHGDDIAKKLSDIDTFHLSPFIKKHYLHLLE